MMDQMMFAPGVQPRRKASTDVNAPMNLFDGDDVYRESNKDSRADPQFQQDVRQERNDQAVERKSRKDKRWRAAKIQVFNFEGRSHRSMVQSVQPSQIVAREM